MTRVPMEVLFISTITGMLTMALGVYILTGSY